MSKFVFITQSSLRETHSRVKKEEERDLSLQA
jgi:hypothetical protein